MNDWYIFCDEIRRITKNGDMVIIPIIGDKSFPIIGVSSGNGLKTGPNGNSTLSEKAYNNVLKRQPLRDLTKQKRILALLPIISKVVNNPSCLVNYVPIKQIGSGPMPPCTVPNLYPNVINIDSSIDLSQNLQFCKMLHEVLMCCPSKNNSSKKGKEFLLSLEKKIPVYLVYEDTFDTIMPPSYEHLESDGDSRGSEYFDKDYVVKKTPYLGCYIPNEKKIYICPERIWRCLKRVEYNHFIMACVKVAVHEFGHAYMDQSQYNGPHDEFYKFVEEPFANVFTLACAEEYDKNNRPNMYHFSSLVRDFIRCQPVNYRLANVLEKQYKGEFVYDLWAISKNKGWNRSVQNDWIDEAIYTPQGCSSLYPMIFGF